MKKALIILLILIPVPSILIFFIVHQSHYVPPDKTVSHLTAEVLYDESHGNAWSIRDTGFYGYSGFAKILIEHSIPVSRIRKPLDRTLKEYSKTVTRKVLVLNVAKFRNYTPGELAAVEAFVRTGGALLCIGEHENIYGSTDFQNAILHQFGFEFTNDFVGEVIQSDVLEEADLTILNQKAESAPFYLRNVHHLLSAPVAALSRKSGYMELLYGYKKGKATTIGAGHNYGKGRVAAIGDSELFWNGDGNIGIGSGDNRRFLVRLFEWLLDGRLVPVKRITHCKFHQNGSATHKRIFIDTSSCGLDINGSPDGLQAFTDFLRGQGHAVCAGASSEEYDVRLIAAPLSEVDCQPEKKEQLILLAGSYQDITPYNDWGNMLLKMKAMNSHSIYQQIERCYGVKIQPCFLTDGGIGKDYFNIDIHYKNFHTSLLRAGSLDIQSNGFNKWLTLDNTVWGETVHPGVENKNRGIPMFDTTDVRNPVLTAWNKRILIIATGDILSNSRSSEKIFIPLCEAIDYWIRTGNIK